MPSQKEPKLLPNITRPPRKTVGGLWSRETDMEIATKEGRKEGRKKERKKERKKRATLKEGERNNNNTTQWGVPTFPRFH